MLLSVDLLHSLGLSCSVPATSGFDVSTFEFAPRLAGHAGRRFPVRSSHLDLAVGVGTVPVTTDLGSGEISRWSPWYGVTVGIVSSGGRSALEIEIGRVGLPRREGDGMTRLHRTLVRFGFAGVVL